MVWRNARVLDMVRGLLARALHRLCENWWAKRWRASARHMERWSTEMVSSLLQKEQFSGWRCESK